MFLYVVCYIVFHPRPLGDAYVRHGDTTIDQPPATAIATTPAFATGAVGDFRRQHTPRLPSGSWSAEANKSVFSTVPAGIGPRAACPIMSFC